MPASTLSIAQTERLGLSLVISQAAYVAMQAYIPWFAAMRTPIAELAMLSLAQSIVWPLAMLTLLQLRSIYLLRGDRDLLLVFYRLRLLGCLLLVSAAAAGAALTGAGRLLLELALMLALIKCTEGLSDIAQAEFQRTLRPEKAALSQTVRCGIFIAAYTVSLTLSSNLVWSLLLALAASSVWVVAFDLRGTIRLQHLGTSDHPLNAVPDILSAGLLLSSATALSSVAIMVGRWAAMLEGDVTTMAAAALAVTASSVVAVLLTTCQQFSIPGARDHFLRGGIASVQGIAVGDHPRAPLCIRGPGPGLGRCIPHGEQLRHPPSPAGRKRLPREGDVRARGLLPRFRLARRLSFQRDHGPPDRAAKPIRAGDRAGASAGGSRDQLHLLPSPGMGCDRDRGTRARLRVMDGGHILRPEIGRVVNRPQRTRS